MAQHSLARSSGAARCAAAEAVHIIMYTQGEVDGNGRRLVCDVTTITANGTPTSTGEALLRAGLSHPFLGAPSTITQAFEEAKTAKIGLFSVLPVALATPAAQFGWLWRLRVSPDATNVCQPLSPCPPPTSDLEAWDCSSHLSHI